MTRTLIYIFEKFGLDALTLGIICYFGWKILTNHFKHLQSDVSEIKNNQKETDKKVDKLGERISKIEGKVE